MNDDVIVSNSLVFINFLTNGVTADWKAQPPFSLLQFFFQLCFVFLVFLLFTLRKMKKKLTSHTFNQNGNLYKRAIHLLWSVQFFFVSRAQTFLVQNTHLFSWPIIIGLFTPETGVILRVYCSHKFHTRCEQARKHHCLYFFIHPRKDGKITLKKSHFVTQLSTTTLGKCTQSRTQNSDTRALISVEAPAIQGGWGSLMSAAPLAESSAASNFCFKPVIKTRKCFSFCSEHKTNWCNGGVVGWAFFHDDDT